MAEIAIAGAVAVLRQAAVILGNLVVQEGSRLFKLKEDMEWIETEMGYIQAYLEDAQSKQGRSRIEATFLNNIGLLAYDVEDVVETYFPQIASQGRKGWLGWLKNAKTVRDFAVEIERIKRRVESVKNARQTYVIRESSGRDEGNTWDARRSFPHIDEGNVIGFDEQIEGLVAKVLDEDLQDLVVSIVGMAGLGKTTLAKKVYKTVQQSVPCSAWIYVSQQPNINELLQNIARQVGLAEKKCEHDVEANLFEFLSQKRYVIVIDDIWHIDPWNALKNGIPTNSNMGSRIIITSRNKNVGVNVGVQVGGQSFLHELQPLGNENSRKLFFKMIIEAPQNNDESCSDLLQLENIGEQILERCDGVPLALVVTAGLLLSRERTTHAWKRVLESMGQDGDQYSEIFSLSYKDLPTKLKPCFLYFGIFPEDFEISAFELINLWAAEGFIQGSEGREVEDVGYDYLNHLIGRNLIQAVRRRVNGRVRSCRIHDILHSLCIRVAKEINFFFTHNDVANDNSTLRLRRITIHGSNSGDYISLNFQALKLRAMLCFNGSIDKQKKLLQNFLRDKEVLRVLSLKCNYLPRFIPDEISNLSHLSYLAFGFSRQCVVELPHAISNLKSLLTLDVRECRIVILPNVIWNMKQLRHILLPEICRWKAPRSLRGVKLDRFYPVEISLPNLQTLYGLPGAELFEADWLRKLTSLRAFQVNGVQQPIIQVLSDENPAFQALEKLVLSDHKSNECGTLNLSQYENLCNLRLEYPIGELPQHDKLPPNLTKLTLEYTHLRKDPMETLQKLPKLKILKLGYESYYGMTIACSGEPGNFPQLEVLKIESLSHLEELIVEEGGMPNLKNLAFFGYDLPVKRIPDRIRNIMTITGGKV